MTNTVRRLALIAAAFSWYGCAPDSAPSPEETVVREAVTGPALELQNLDEVPFPDRLVTSKLTDTSKSQVTHTKAKLKLNSVGTTALSITSFAFTGPWHLNPSVMLPLTIAPGSSSTVTVELTATSGGKVLTGKLAIGSNAGTTNVQLAGTRTAPEGGNEPSLQQVVDTFGWKTMIAGAGQTLVHQGRVEAIGDEILAPYWKMLDGATPVVIWELAAFHGRTSRADLWWFQQGSTTTNILVSLAATNAQTLLPRKEGSTTAAAKASFSNDGVFGFKQDQEWSDPTKNDASGDISKGCTAPCGHHVRFWPIKDRVGVMVPGAFLMAVDSHGINYDYQDNVYLVTNVIPADATPTLPSAPTGLTATPGDGQVTLKWNAVSGATSYTVKMSDTMGGTHTPVQAGITGTSFTVLGLANGTTVFFTVSATNAVGEGPDSSEVSATPIVPSAVPISDLVVNDTAAGGDGISNNTQWSIQASFQPNTKPFGDRTFTAATVPPAFVGLAWIRTAADSKSYASTTTPLATFAVGGTTVFLAVDNRYNGSTGRPAFLDASFTASGSEIIVRQSSTATFRYSVWKKPVTPGSTVTLPTIGATTAPLYFVLVQ